MYSPARDIQFVLDHEGMQWKHMSCNHQFFTTAGWLLLQCRRQWWVRGSYYTEDKCPDRCFSLNNICIVKVVVCFVAIVWNTLHMQHNHRSRKQNQIHPRACRLWIITQSPSCAQVWWSTSVRVFDWPVFTYSTLAHCLDVQAAWVSSARLLEGVGLC